METADFESDIVFFTRVARLSVVDFGRFWLLRPMGKRSPQRETSRRGFTAPPARYRPSYPFQSPRPRRAPVERRGLKQIYSSFTGICFRFRPACPGGVATASYLQNSLARSISAPGLSRRNQRIKSCDRRGKPETSSTEGCFTGGNRLCPRHLSSSPFPPAIRLERNAM
ncbi:hypothetical protein CA85_27740 [Allorhodopirellula solitaria]|uniref:Uncharacterized protein n=1 Tax=Allorhodopirellula solitaria TaxID=2527987 RepID=A0A5C5XTW7_9BACT|nr:hypothetical protein CA85_27740 [Allorhodopirellula solitaria]